MSKNSLKIVMPLALLVIVLLLTGCELRQALHDQPKYRPYRASDFFDDGRSARMPVEGTVPRGHMREDAYFYTGKKDGKDVHAFPMKVTKEVIKRGQERYQIYCLPCHGFTGAGDGMVVQRGYKTPVTYHSDNLRNAAIGHFFDVMTNGWGQMPAYAAQIPTKDRWAIAAYIKALQLSQNYRYDELNEADKHAFNGDTNPSAPPTTDKHHE